MRTMIKCEEILIKGGRHKETICDIFRYEPENIEETALGNLYMVAQLNIKEDSAHLASLLSSLIKREYYSSPHRGPLESLESSLKKANQTLNDFASQGNLEWLGKFNFICAAINKEQDLFLSQSGGAQAFLCREGQLTNVSKKIVPEPTKHHPAKTFQSVISGQISANDKLIFATPALFEFFSPQSFKELLGFPSLDMISDQINKTLREQKKLPSMGALLLEIIPEEMPVPVPRTKKGFITPPIKLEEILGC